jgi:hypothetical protein
MEPAPLAPGKDYILTGNEFPTSPSQRFDANLEAIRLVKQLEREGRLANDEEQVILARYSGFGDSAFNPAFPSTAGYRRDDIWRQRGEQLRELLTDEEFQSLERSRLTAFYTTSQIVNAMWDGLKQMGADQLQRPRILEPSAGSGRFLGLQPVELAARSQRTAVELDHMTGAMLKHLYPNADVYPGTGYQNAPIPNESVDIAISNVPFGNIPVTDRDFLHGGRRLMSRSIHNYFFAKTMDKLRPGGMLAFITSHHTLDAPAHQ